jgi:hypothetical protein
MCRSDRLDCFATQSAAACFLSIRMQLMLPDYLLLQRSGSAKYMRHTVYVYQRNNKAHTQQEKKRAAL